MAFLGILLMIQGFGNLVANVFFDRNFGLLHRILEGGALTAASAVVGLAGLAMLILSARAEDR
ncbi:hypothetical protein [Nonomuraea jiangxiensis]|uniref:Uncharacterized protein n=1 Tax=Nonomuraea jiangxiensis TaxID=633440 RepID=A0A1G9DML3_9ACTN|nr:hypothetical protein [Nonomuraea jiangxiensis]SDK65119.1 hypothetical protein SAMN05421869_117192 [Nonomuraea jiangxiensis]